MLGEISRWLAALAILGIVSFPLSYWFFRFLPGRGAAFSRLIGLVLIGYFFWLLNVLGLGGNNGGMQAFAGLILLALSALSLKHQIASIRGWLRENWRHLLICEMLFLAGFVLIVCFRLADPSISGTEKPMEMMFINSILISEALPPHDGWLSGYSISYYYFGYVLTAILIRFTQVPPSVGFNLMLATVFALAAPAAFAIVNDLLQGSTARTGAKIKNYGWALLSPLFLLLAGNLEGLFETLHARGWFWKADGTSTFWAWLDLQELNQAPTLAPSWNPTGRQGIWWWRASRVLTDRGLDGSVKEIIDEFPFFSFYLGDLHPHVLGIPFVLMAVAIALNLFMRTSISYDGIALEDFNLAGIVKRWLQPIAAPRFLLSALCIGGLIFMNTWDFPIYFALFCAGAVFHPAFQWRGIKRIVFDTLKIAVPFGLCCVGFYFLFLSGLSSQAGGLIPSGVFATRLPHFLIMFGGMLLPILSWLVLSGKRAGSLSLRTGFRFSGILLLILLVAETLIVGLLVGFHNAGAQFQQSANAQIASFGSMAALAGNAFTGVQGMNGHTQPFLAYLLRRLSWLPLALLLFAALGLVVAVMVAKIRSAVCCSEPSECDEFSRKTLLVTDRFAALLALLAFGLIIVPEFFYLRDFFGTRMNTIFKFYYQVWILFSLIAAYAVARIREMCRRNGQRLTGAVVYGLSALLLAFALIYPFWGISTKIDAVSAKVDSKQLTP